VSEQEVMITRHENNVLIALAKLESKQEVLIDKIRDMAEKEAKFHAAMKEMNEKIETMQSKMNYAAGAVLVITTVVGFFINIIVKKFS